MTRIRNKVTGGFTLIELITVVVIISFMVMAAVTQMDGLIPQYALRSACREVGSILKTARHQAVTTGKDVYVEFDLAQGQYWVLAPFVKKADEEAAKPAEPQETPQEPQYEYLQLFKTRLADGIDMVDVILSKDQTMKTGKATVRVTPFGLSNHVIVNLKNRDQAQMAVKFNGFTGAISYYDQYKEPEEILVDE